jgi:hypothetical protein
MKRSHILTFSLTGISDELRVDTLEAFSTGLPERQPSVTAKLLKTCTKLRQYAFRRSILDDRPTQPQEIRQWTSQSAI